MSSPSAEIKIDNQIFGRTPYELELPEGEYLLTLTPEDDETDATQSASWNGKVSINAHSLTYVNRELGSSDLLSSGVTFSVKKMDRKPSKADSGEIEIRTEPDGAIVFLDNEEQGIAPLILSEVSQGDHEVSVYSPGFSRLSQKIRVQPQHRIIGDFKLSLDPTYKKIKKEEKKEATESAKIQKQTILTIKETSTGWLRVREEPSLNSSESAKIKPGEKFTMLEEKDGWYKIYYENEKEGWISSRYAETEEVTNTTPEDEL